MYFFNCLKYNPTFTLQVTALWCVYAIIGLASAAINTSELIQIYLFYGEFTVYSPSLQVKLQEDRYLTYLIFYVKSILN